LLAYLQLGADGVQDHVVRLNDDGSVAADDVTVEDIGGELVQLVLDPRYLVGSRSTASLTPAPGCLLALLGVRRIMGVA
jgi:hypothetical protein